MPTSDPPQGEASPCPLEVLTANTRRPGDLLRPRQEPWRSRSSPGEAGSPRPSTLRVASPKIIAGSRTPRYGRARRGPGRAVAHVDTRSHGESPKEVAPGQQAAPLREVGPDLRLRWWRGQD